MQELGAVLLVCQCLEHMFVYCCVYARPGGTSSVYIYVYMQDHVRGAMHRKHFYGIGHMSENMGAHSQAESVRGSFCSIASCKRWLSIFCHEKSAFSFCVSCQLSQLSYVFIDLLCN